MSTFKQLQSALGEVTREFRTNQRWSLRELERRSTIRKGTLSNIENAKSNPCIETLEKLATAFGMNLATFIRQVEERAAQSKTPRRAA